MMWTFLFASFLCFSVAGSSDAEMTSTEAAFTTDAINTADIVLCTFSPTRLCVPENETVLTFEVLCDKPIDVTGFVIGVEFDDEDALSDEDFFFSNWDLEIPVETVFFTAGLHIVDDGVVEGPEEFVISPGPVIAPPFCSDTGPLPNIVICGASYTVTIKDNDELCDPLIEATTEPIEVTTDADFFNPVVCTVLPERLCVPENQTVLTLEVLCDTPINVPGFIIGVEFDDEDAVSGEDFIFFDGELEIPVETVFFTAGLNIVDDGLVEDQETFVLSSGSVIAPPFYSDTGPLPDIVICPFSYTVTITDNDEPCDPIIAETTASPLDVTTDANDFCNGAPIVCDVSPRTLCINEGTPVITLEVLCDQPIGTPGFVIGVNLAGDTTPNQDFFFSNSDLEIPVGSVYFTANIYVIDDSEAEESETLALSSGPLITPIVCRPTGVCQPDVVVCPFDFSVTILDNDVVSGSGADPGADPSQSQRGLLPDFNYDPDTDPCLPDPCEGEHRVCRDHHGLPICLCDTGYQIGVDLESCQDINECLITPCRGKKDEECVNTVGSFECECRDGYQRSGNDECDDINECLMNPCRDEKTEECMNTEGSFVCECMDGYQRSSYGGCEDINECLITPCSDEMSEECVNTEGSFECECKDGYQQSSYGGCKATGWCLLFPDLCHQVENSHCVDVALATALSNGSYRCDCDTGFAKTDEGTCVKLDGSDAEQLLTANCPPAYYPPLGLILGAVVPVVFVILALNITCCLCLRKGTGAGTPITDGKQPLIETPQQLPTGIMPSYVIRNPLAGRNPHRGPPTGSETTSSERQRMAQFEKALRRLNVKKENGDNTRPVEGTDYAGMADSVTSDFTVPYQADGEVNI